MAELPPPPDQTLDSPSPLPDQPVDSGSASDPAPSLVRNVSLSKLSAKAMEFVPSKPPTPPPIAIAPPSPPPPPIVHVFPPPFHAAIPPPQSHLHHPHIQQQQQFHQPLSQPHHQYHPGHHQKHHGNSGGGEQEAVAQGQSVSSHSKDHGNGGSSNGLSEEATQKLVNQVEYYFSDINLATTDHLIRFMNKDSEGYVPISVVASFKKIKALVSSNSQLADVLRNSTKLVVSEDGKKVKRLHHLTGPDMDELQGHIIVAENLPEDHCYQNLMKVFSSVGSVKSIRTCQPQTANTGAPPASRQSKADNMLLSSKLHAFVEYDSIELAEKAVLELNDGDNWRNGLRVRLLLKRSSKPQQARGRRAASEGEVSNDEEGTSRSEQIQNERQSSEEFLGESELHPHEHAGEEQGTEKEGGQKKGRNRGRGKGRGRGQNHQNSRAAHHIGSPPTNLGLNMAEHLALAKPPPGPRMPDGTRGFSMGRGKPVAVNTA